MKSQFPLVDEFLHKVGDKQHPRNHECHWEGESDAVEIAGEVKRSEISIERRH